MGFKTFNTKLLSILNELVSEDDTKPLAVAYGWNNAQPEGFPFAMTYQIDGSSEEAFQTYETLTTMKFVIIALWEAKDFNETKNGEMLEAQDEILAKLRTPENFGTLGGTVHQFKILSIDPITPNETEPYNGFQIVVSGAIRNCQQ